MFQNVDVGISISQWSHSVWARELKQNVIGHEDIKDQLLKTLMSGWGINCALFSGPPSVGKRTTAFELSKYLLCLNDSLDDFCTCRSCSLNINDHPDFLCLGRTERIKVLDIDKILEMSSLSPFLSNKRIIILDNADNITVEASNRLLKILEEPPKNVHFFLISSCPGYLLKTILSRCITYEFKSLSQVDCINVIIKKLGFDAPKARVLGWIGSGSSIDVFSKAGAYLKHRDNALGFLSTFKSKDPLDSLDYLDKIEKAELSIFHDMVMMIITDIIIIKENVGCDIINSDIRSDLEKLVEKFNSKALVSAVAILSQVKKFSNYNVNMLFSFKSAILKSFPLLSVTSA